MRFGPSRLIVVLDLDNSYPSLIRRSGLDCEICTVLNLGDLLFTTQANHGSIGLVEFDWQETDKLANAIAAIGRFRRRSADSILFAAGNREIRPITRELLIAGFAQVFCSKASYRQIATTADRYWNSLNWPRQNLEDLVDSNLPWEPIE